MLKAPEEKRAENYKELVRLPAGLDFVGWLEESRQNLLEVLPKITDDVTLRRTQGAALAISDILDVFKRIKA